MLGHISALHKLNASISVFGVLFIRLSLVFHNLKSAIELFTHPKQVNKIKVIFLMILPH